MFSRSRLLWALAVVVLLDGRHAAAAEKPSWPPRLYGFCMELPAVRNPSIPDQAKLLGELGFDGVGYPLWLGDDMDKNLRSLDEAGATLHLAYMTVDLDPKKTAFDARVPAAIARLKGRPVTVSVLIRGFPPGDPRGMQRAVKILRQLGDLAAKSGLRVSIYHHLGDWTESLLHSLEVVKTVDRANVGVNFNLCHWLKIDGDKDYRPVLRENGKRIFAVTINGAQRGAKTWKNGLIQPLDRGDFDNRELLGLLKEIGYRGPVGLMCYGIPDDTREHLQRSMQTWKSWHAPANDRKTLAFAAGGKQFSFDTGSLSGVLRQQGKAKGLAPLVDAATGTNLSRPLGIFSHYRLLATNSRYGHAAWDWTDESKLSKDGAVEAVWRADEKHPFDMKAVYRWTKSDTLDLVTTVTARKDLARFEVFLASYFNGFAESWVYAKDPEGKGGKAAFLQANRDEGVWHMFPRDDRAIDTIRDGRWKQPPHPVNWVIRPKLAGPLAMRRDRQTGLVALVMAPPEDCFAVSTPYGEEGHRSLYLSLLGQDFKAGQAATVRSRLVIRRDISFEDAIRIYREYLDECNKD